MPAERNPFFPWILGLTSLMALGTGGCASRKPTPTGQAAESPWVAAAKGRVDLEGGVIRLAARRDGIIESVQVEEGARVQAGQVLARLEDAAARHSQRVAEAEVDLAERQTEPVRLRHAAAQREVRRLEPLAPSGDIRGQELDAARDALAGAAAELEERQASIRLAQRRLAMACQEREERVVRAPMDGQIVQRLARPGFGVSTLNTTPLFLFAPEAPRIIRAELEERSIPLVQPGQKAEVALEAAPEPRVRARVLRLGKVVGARTPSDDPVDRQDARVVECVLALEAPTSWLIGQRVLVRFLP